MMLNIEVTGLVGTGAPVWDESNGGRSGGFALLGGDVMPDGEAVGMAEGNSCRGVGGCDAG